MSDPAAYDEALADVLAEDAFIILDTSGDSHQRDTERAAEAADLRGRLLDGTATDEDRATALDHLHPTVRRRFEAGHARPEPPPLDPPPSS